MTTTAQPSRNPSSVRHRALTDEAAIAGIDQACKRLRLPTIRHNVADTIAAATSGQWSYHGLLAELLLAERDDRDRRSVVRRVKSAGSPRQKWLADFDFDANDHINPATVNTLASGEWVRTGYPLCLIGDSAPANRTCSSAWGLRPPRKGSALSTPWPRNSSTSSSRPPTTKPWPKRSPATVASTYSSSTNSATWNSTAAAPNSCSRS
jgi:hypothetical protein